MENHNLLIKNKKKLREDYGIYTVGDENFFAGIVASVNALRYYGYRGSIAVIDIGFEDWMRTYLLNFADVAVLDISEVSQHLRFTDVRSNESPVMRGWAYKAFSIAHYDLFSRWTFIDGDYLPLCNLESELRPLTEKGLFVSTEDGVNDWTEEHEAAIGVGKGSYMNINAGFISLDMEVHGFILHEWRNLMTRSKPFDLWYGDQGALNAVLDKWGVHKHTLNKVLWNQTWINESMAHENSCQITRDGRRLYMYHAPSKQRIMGWHGMGWNKLWHQIGIDHYRKNDEGSRMKFYSECQGKSPKAIIEAFEHFLFLDEYNAPLKRNMHLLVPPASMGCHKCEP